MTCDQHLQWKNERRAGVHLRTINLPGKGKKADFSSCGETVEGGTGLVGILLAKPFTVGFSEVSCCAGFVTLMVDFLKLFHRPKYKMSNTKQV